MDIPGFVSQHKEGIGLLALALVATMRDELPPPFNRFGLLVWFYGWIHDALKTLVNLRRPAVGKPSEGDKG